MTHCQPSNVSPGAAVDQILEQASHLLLEKSPAAAEHLCRGVLEIQPDHPEAHYLLGLLCIQSGQAAAGLDHFDAAIDKRPDHGPYWLAYIEALEQTGQPALARQVLEMARQAGLSGKEVESLAKRLGTQGTCPDRQLENSDFPHREVSGASDNRIPEQHDIDTLVSLYQQGKTADCEKHARFLLSGFPNHGFTWKVLGAVLQQQRRLHEALDAMRQATSLLPQDHEALNNLGLTFKTAGNLVESEKTLRQALTLKEDFPEGQNNLGVTLMALGRCAEAETCYRRALHLLPDYLECLCNLGVCLSNLGRFAEAEACLRDVLQARPDYAEGWNNLGNLLKGLNKLAEAESCLRKALELQPDFAVAWNNLGNVLQGQGSLEEAERCYHQALHLQPDFADAFDGLLFTANYHPDRSAEELSLLYRRYNEQFCLPLLKEQQPHLNAINPGRRLKIGYVSPAFYRHPVYHFLQPLLARHDKNHFEVYAYSETLREDAATTSCRQHCDHWISTIGLSDEELAARIRADRIDILVDLAGHTGRNRLLVFARKPAPVSLHWLDFGYTTGLTAIDYYLTDLSCAPLGSEHLFSERLWRLPGPPFAYRPEPGMGEVSLLPADRKGHVTFGTLSRAIRINHLTIRVWSEILHRVENARLVIDSGNFKDQAGQDALREKFRAHGVDGDRLIIGYHSPPWDVLRETDISLDCFPHNSGTTLIESLYLGVPFITLAERPGVGRLGCSILDGCGHPEWVAESEEEYVEKAVALATDLPRLANIRKNLRQELEASSLMDERGFTENIESAYRQMFQRWCATVAPAKECGKALDARPTGAEDEAATCYNLGVDHHTQNRLAEAKNYYTQALNLDNGLIHASHNLGVILLQQGKLGDAAASFLHTLELRSDYTDASYNLGNTYKLQHNLLQAEQAYRRTLASAPDHINALYHLGNILQEQGRPQEAEPCLRKALALAPGRIDVFSTLLYTLNYHPDKSPEEIYQAYQEFNTRYFPSLPTAWRPHGNTPLNNRRLRVAYVAADYRSHPARYFLLPLLAHHDKRTMEIYAYVERSGENTGDDIFHGLVDHWLATPGLTDDQLSERIRADEIDVLIDLAGHTASNRLGVFAQKPAPVSLHWLDFGYTTGLTSIDYYLTDPTAVPQGCEHLFAEKPWRLETPALAYRPPEATGPVNPLPAKKNGYITFGTLTRAVRINHRTIRVWSEILKRCQGARLIINSGSYREKGMQDALAARFADHGIERDRLDIGSTSPPWDVLRQMDIGFDCFPHNSGTTLVESLYMGVPYITLANRPSVGRLGASILEGAGHPEWIAATEEEYIAKALAMAADPSCLATIRSSLRDDLAQGPLMDEKSFTRRVETALLEMFDSWCAANPRKTLDTDTGKPHKKLGKLKQKASRAGAARKSQPTVVSNAETARLAQLFNSGNLAEATQLARSLTTRHPGYGFGWKVLGPLLFQQGMKDEAIEAMTRAAACLPGDAETHANLGIALEQEGLFTEAEQSYKRAIRCDNKHVQAHFNLANIFKKQKRYAEAEAEYKLALKCKPDFFEACSNLGNILKDQNRLDEAERFYSQALELKPDSPEACCNIGNLRRLQKRLPEAIRIFFQALKLNPALAKAHNNLGICFQEQGLFTHAEASYHQAMQLDPHYAEAYSNMGTLASLQSRTQEAEIYLKRALEINPNQANIHSNLLFVLNYHPDRSGEDIFQHYRDFDTRFGLPLQKEWRRHGNNRLTARRLKLGYVSPRYCHHPVEYFLEPLLANHDRREVEVYLYSDTFKEDAITRRYKTCADHWVETANLDDRQLAERIRQDRIDVLIDLAGHTGNNRLMVFARKPAPVSLHWLDFGYTTGLTAIDYYLSDSATVPPGSEHLFSEKPWRVATPCLAYRPATGIGEVSPLPAAAQGYVAFGTLTRAVRINYRTIRVWAEILRRVPNSKLIMNSGSFQDPAMCKEFTDKFAAHGIAPERLDIGSESPPWNILRRTDIGFDCFPHNSGTTLFENLYMGVPYITLADRPSIGRLGCAILEGAGHPEWIAQTEDEYVELAVKLAADLPRLAAIRANLREEMQRGPLMDEPGFARKVEAAYREMFMKWSKGEK